MLLVVIDGLSYIHDNTGIGFGKANIRRVIAIGHRSVQFGLHLMYISHTRVNVNDDLLDIISSERNVHPLSQLRSHFFDRDIKQLCYKRKV